MKLVPFKVRFLFMLLPRSLRCSLLLLVPSCFAIAQAHVLVPTTWWPDPQTGLMWTGTPIMGKSTVTTLGHSIDHPTAVMACSGLVYQGLTGWRLPTQAEFIATVAHPYIEETSTTHQPLIKGEIVTLLGPGEDSTLKFMQDFNAYVWTSDVGTAPQDFLNLHFPGMYPYSVKASSHFGSAVLCVRTMEPDLRKLAAESATAVPVHSTDELRAIVPILASEVSLGKSDTVGALAAAERAVQMDPNSAYSVDVVAKVAIFQGDWDRADAVLQQAQAQVPADEQQTLKYDLKLVTTLRKQSKKDAHALEVYDQQTIAYLTYRQGDYAASAKAAAEWVRLQPKNWQAYRELGLAEARLGHWPEAIAALKKISDHEASGADPEVEHELSTAKALNPNPRKH